MLGRMREKFGQFKNAAVDLKDKIADGLAPATLPAKKYVAAPLAIASRTIFNAGQHLFAMGKFSAYALGGAKSVAGIIATSIAIGGSTIVNLVARAPMIKDKIIADKQEQALPDEYDDEDGIHLNPLARAVNILLKTSGVTFGALNGFVAYFATEELIETVATLMNKNIHGNKTQEALLQGASILVAVSALASYFAYDQKVLKENADIIATGINERSGPQDTKAFWKTMAASAINLISYPMLGFFWAKSALTDIPFASKLLGKLGVNFVTGLSALTTFFTVASWLPSVYKYFKSDTQAPNPDEPVFKGAQSSSAKLASAFVTPAGIADSVGTGVGTYMSIIFTLSTIAGMNPYGVGLIAMGIIGGANAGVVNALFHVKPGRDYTIKILNGSPSEGSSTLARSRSESPTSSPSISGLFASNSSSDTSNDVSITLEGEQEPESTPLLG